MKDLSVFFDTKLTFIEHITATVIKAYQMLGFVIRTTLQFNDTSCTNFLYNFLVRSRLESNCTVWNPYQITYKQNIERIQKKYTRQLFYNFKYERTLYEYRIEILNMTKLEHRREYLDTCLLYDIVHDRNRVRNYRPMFRIGRLSYRTNIVFKPPRLYNIKFKHIDIVNSTREQFRDGVWKRLTIS